jgi:hypothetical protein
MADLASDGKVSRCGVAVVDPMSYPIAAASILYAGRIVALNVAGNAIGLLVAASNAYAIVGVASKQIDNTTGAAGDVSVEVENIYYVDNDTTNPITAAHIKRGYCYVVDNHTVGSSNVGGSLPLAGVPVKLGTAVDGTAGKVAVAFGAASAYALNPLLDSANAADFTARNVAAAGNVASLAAFTVAGNDGVTNVAGDVVVLLEQTTAAACGPYVVGTVASGSAPLVRPDWWPTGATLPAGIELKLGGEGTVFKSCNLKAMLAAKNFVVGTTDPELYPERVEVEAVLVAGTVTLSSIPVLSLNTQVLCSRKAANTSTATTGGYHATVAGANGLTAGKRGTGSIVIQATVAAGTINVADVSTLHVTVINGQR